MISGNVVKLDTDTLFCRMLEEAFTHLHFEDMRFKLEKTSIAINKEDTNIIVCVPSFVNDETPRTFSFFKALYPISNIRVSEIGNQYGYLGEFNGQINSILNGDYNQVIVAHACLIVSGSIVLKPIDIKGIVDESLYIKGADVLSTIKEGVHPPFVYYPFDYNEETLREMGVTGIKLDILSMDFGPMDDSFIIAFAKHHLASLSLQSTVRVLEYIKHAYLRTIEDCDHQYSAIDYDLRSGLALKEQEWLFHLQCVFQLYSDYFITAEECSMKEHILNYCKSRICDLKPAKLTQAIANTNGNSISDKILMNVHKWLAERGHIAIQGVDEDESVNHFIYIITGRNEDLISSEMKKQRIKWIGKDKFIFVTFIKELYGSIPDKKDPYIEWSDVLNQFDADFGEPINGALARKVTRNICYKRRHEARISGHGDIRDLYLVFHS